MIRKSLKFSNLSFILVMGLVACNKPKAPDCFQKGGDRDIIERSYETAITSLLLNDHIHVNLIPSDQNKVSIEGPSNLLPEIITDLNGSGVLEVRNDNTCNFVRNLSPDFQVTIYAQPRQIEVLGTGNLNFMDTLHVDDFSIVCDNSSGSMNLLLNCEIVTASVIVGLSDMTMKGNCFRLDVFNQGINTVDCSEMQSRFTALVSNSINSLYGRSSEYLYVNILSSGDIFYYGNPNTVDEEGEGEGHLIFSGE